MDGGFSNGGSPHLVAGGEEMGAPEQAPTAGHELRNAHASRASDDPEAETTSGHEGPLTQQAQADAEELLSRASAHAELLRAYAEAARAEAASLRAEAAALRRAAREGLTDAISRAEALAVEMHAAADVLRSVREGQADEARAEIERVRTEADSLRRLLQAETDAALADTQRLRAEVQGLRADINKLAADLQALSPAGDAANTAAVDFNLSREADAPLDELRRTIVMEVEQKLANAYAASRDHLARGEPRPRFPGFDHREAASRSEPHHDPDWGFPMLDVRERLRRIWDGTYGEGTGQAPLGDQAAEHGPSGPSAPEPLIGSGGWRPSTGPSPVGAPSDSDAERESSSPPADVGRHRWRFGRPA